MMKLPERAVAFARALDEHDVPGAASAMAFHAFFSLMPLIALIGCGFFRFATSRRDGVQRRGFLGAIVTIVAWVVVSLLFSFYVREIGSYSRFYGSLAAVAVLLVWLWLMAVSLLVGGEVNARI